MIGKLLNRLGGKSTNHQRQIRFSFDGKTISADGPFAERTSVKVEDIYEIGVETTDAGPFVEDVFWLINKDTDGLRIPQMSPVFTALMDYFGSLESFDWRPFNDAMCCTDSYYFRCWKRAKQAS